MKKSCLVLCCGFIAACSGPLSESASPSGETTMSWPSPAVGPYLVEMAAAVDGFETGDLTGWGGEGAWVSSETDTGIARVVTEGEDFAARLGEEQITLLGNHALALQLTAAEGTATLTSEPFVPDEPHLLFAQLSEVDSRGIVLQVEVLDGCVRTLYDVPARTGGHRPGLDDGDDRLDAFPEIGYDEGYPGAFTYQAIDLASFYKRGAEIQVRFVQRSMVEPFDFFTLLDDICLIDIPDAYLDDVPLYYAIEA